MSIQMTRLVSAAPSGSAAATANQPARLAVDGLSKRYGEGQSGKLVIDGMSFSVQESELVSIVGPSGVGKTTLLKCMSGLIPITSGTIAVDGTPISGPPREMALVFQDYTRSLLPWLKIEKNVMLPLRGSGISRAEMRARSRDALKKVALERAIGQYPWQLSGGMQQRVSIARALAYRPEILVMDEPFASLDAQTRFGLEDLLLHIRDDLGITIVFVTHDIDEAVYLSDRIVVLGSSPAHVREVVDVDLDHPRDQAVTRSDPRFAELRTHVLRQIQH